MNGVPLYNDGQFAGYIGSCVDITDQKLSTERLRGSEARLAYAQRLAHVGSFERDVGTKLCSVVRGKASYPWTLEWTSQLRDVLELCSSEG